MEVHLFFQYIGVAIFIIGCAESLLFSIRVFRKSGGFDNYQISHLKASIFGFLRFIPYLILVLIFFGISEYFEIKK